MVGIYSLIEIIVLILNGLAVLHDERFLAPYGLGYRQETDQFGQPRSGVKQRIAELLYAVRLIGRIPLLIANVVVIVLELVFG